MIVKERRTEQGLLVSVCDADVIGETFENGEVSLTVEEEFYAGDGADEVDDEAVIDSLARAAIANIVGTEAVALAIEAGIVDPGQVLEVGETLHAQYLQF